jgi:hypothetical protein
MILSKKNIITISISLIFLIILLFQLFLVFLDSDNSNCDKYTDEKSCKKHHCSYEFDYPEKCERGQNLCLDYPEFKCFNPGN